MATDAPAGTMPGGMDAPPAMAPRALRAPGRAASARGVRRLMALVLVLVAAACAADAGWIHAKAALAQVLLERAWTRTLADGGAHRPWAWADTAPVARLTAPAHGVGQIVLAGDSGRTLAFGPGWAQASAPPGQPGTTIISGHRDTHFAWLQALAVGDRLELEGAGGRRAYRVAASRVADAGRERIGVDPGTDALLLVTCWPFDAVAAGGPLRYLVTALPDD
jgi:sortase A